MFDFFPFTVLTEAAAAELCRFKYASGMDDIYTAEMIFPWRFQI